MIRDYHWCLLMAKPPQEKKEDNETIFDGMLFAVNDLEGPVMKLNISSLSEREALVTGINGITAVALGEERNRGLFGQTRNRAAGEQGAFSGGLCAGSLLGCGAGRYRSICPVVRHILFVRNGFVYEWRTTLRVSGPLYDVINENLMLDAMPSEYRSKVKPNFTI